MTSIDAFSAMEKGRLTWVGGPPLFFLTLSVPLFVLISLWKTKNGRVGGGEFILPLSVLGVCLLVLLVTMGFLWIYLRNSYRPPQFKWAILLLMLGLLFLAASFQFLVAMPTDGEEGWSYIFGSLTYPFFVGFSSIWFLFYITVSLTTKVSPQGRTPPN